MTYVEIMLYSNPTCCTDEIREINSKSKISNCNNNIIIPQKRFKFLHVRLFAVSRYAFSNLHDLIHALYSFSLPRSTRTTCNLAFMAPCIPNLQMHSSLFTDNWHSGTNIPSTPFSYSRHPRWRLLFPYKLLNNYSEFVRKFVRIYTIKSV